MKRNASGRELNNADVKERILNNFGEYISISRQDHITSSISAKEGIHILFAMTCDFGKVAQ
jgi:hypothetical protein